MIKQTTQLTPRFSFLILLLLVFAISTIVQATPTTTPTVTTNAASGFSTTGATCGGNISSTGGKTVTAEGVNYGTVITYGSTKTASPTVQTGSFSVGLTGLSSNTIYYYRAYATNSNGTGYGAQATFTTVPGAPTNLSAGTITGTSIVLNWTKPAGDGADTYTAQGSTNWQTFSSPYSPASYSGTSATFTGLTPGTTYYFRVEATTSGGTGAWSCTPCLCGITTYLPPVVTTTTPATNITTSSATLGGKITNYNNGDNDADDHNTCDAEGVAYGTSPNPVEPGKQTTSVTTTFSVNVTGLSPNTTYHYRAWAHNAGGYGYGADQTFKTLPLPVVTYGVDVTIGPDGNGSALGSGVINTTGLNQTETTTLPSGTPGSYDVIVKNTGNGTDSFYVGGNTGSGTGYTVTYTDETGAAGNVTASMVPGPWTITLAAGATQTIRVAVTLTDAFGGGNTAAITIGAESEGNSADVDIVGINATLAVRYGVDVTIGPVGNGGALGSGTLNTTGAGQTETTSIPAGTPASYDVVVNNTGNVTDTFYVGGNYASGTGYAVTYTDETGAAGNVTSSMVPGPWTVTLAAGQTETIRVTVTLTSAFGVGNALDVSVAAESEGNTNDVDVVGVDATLTT